MSDPARSLSLLAGTFDNSFAFIALLFAVALGLFCIRKSYGLSFFLSIAGTFGATHIIKSITKVPRPDDALIEGLGYRFPSMHAAIAGAVIASLAWHMATRANSNALKIAIALCGALIVAFVSLTRVYLGVHEMVDVIVGALLGAGIGMLVHALMRHFGLE